MKASLYLVQTKSGHSPDQKSKSNLRPSALVGTLIRSFTSMTSWTVESTSQSPLLRGNPGGASSFESRGWIAAPPLNGVFAVLLDVLSYSRAHPELSTPSALPSRGFTTSPNF